MDNKISERCHVLKPFLKLIGDYSFFSKDIEYVPVVFRLPEPLVRDYMVPDIKTGLYGNMEGSLNEALGFYIFGIL